MKPSGIRLVLGAYFNFVLDNANEMREAKWRGLSGEPRSVTDMFGDSKKTIDGKTRRRLQLNTVPVTRRYN
jgi:hypothetical protein